MIRHSSSLFISISLHLFVAGLVFFLYSIYTPPKKIIEEKKRVVIQLSNIVKEKKVQPQPMQTKTTTPPKKQKPKLKKKITPKKNVIKKKLSSQKKSSSKKTIIVKKKKILKPTQHIIKKEIKKVMPPQTISEKKPPLSPQIIKKAPKQDSTATLQKDYIDKNLAKIRELIKENLYYPRRARKKHIVGDVIVKFKLSKDATISSIEVVSSKDEILSRSAIKTIEQLSSVFPKPKEAFTLEVPISYRLK